MRKWRLPLTYEPKIEPVRKGECRQTIRECTISKSKQHPGKIIRKEVGDLIRFFGWTGRPYWSKQIVLTEYEPLVTVINILITQDGITRFWHIGMKTARSYPNGCFMSWEKCGCLAARDYIIPPTGDALRDVLISKNGEIPSEGIEAQILRW